MISSNFRIVPCELADMSVCVDIFDEAFAGDPAMLYLHPRSDPKVLKEISLRNFERSYAAPATYYFKAIHEETGWVWSHLYYASFTRCRFIMIEARGFRVPLYQVL